MINHEKEIYLIFLLAIDRSWLSIRQASWTRFTIDHSKIQNECKFFIGDGIFSLLVRNPSAASAITMPANGESLLGRSSVGIRTLHDCPSQMKENLLISNSKLTSDSELIWWR